jgi:hypothetical protein
MDALTSPVKPQSRGKGKNPAAIGRQRTGASVNMPLAFLTCRSPSVGDARAKQQNARYGE